MHHAFLCSLVVTTILLSSSVKCSDEYEDVQDSDAIPIFDTCGTMLDEYVKASLKTLAPDERHWFYDSIVIERIEREENLTRERLKNEITLDYDNIKDTTEQTLYKTCGTLLQDYWENYSLRNLTSQEKAFYYDENVMKEIKEDEEKMIQERKDEEWLRKMDHKIINEQVDSDERGRTTDKDYHDWQSPVPKTTVMVASPIDNLFCSQASNVSDTDISQETFKREVRYGDVPKWLADRYDKIHDSFIEKKDRRALHDAFIHGRIASTGRLETEPSSTTKKRRLLTHRYDRTQTSERTLQYKQARHSRNKTKARPKRNIDVNKTNGITRRKPVRITNEDGIHIPHTLLKFIRQNELQDEREEKQAKKEAEKLKMKKLRKEIRRSKTKSTKFTRRRKTENVASEIETTSHYIKHTRRAEYVTWSKTLGLYGPLDLINEVTQPNAEQTEIGMDALFEYLKPSTNTKRPENAPTPRKRIRQSTTPYYEHTLPNRFNRTVYYWMHEKKMLQHVTPPEQNDSVGMISLEHSEETPLEILFMDYLFNTRRSPPTLKLNLTTVTISNREYESYLAKHQIFRKIHADHMRLATMSHWNFGDTRFMKGNLDTNGLGADFFDRRPYSSTRRQDNVIYEDLEFFGNFTKPDFVKKKYTFASSYEHYEDVFEKHILDPGHVTANWTTINFSEENKIRIAPHQIHPNGTLKSVETLIKEDYEFRKNVFGKSCDIYDEEFARDDLLTQDSGEYLEGKKKIDKFFFPNVNNTIGPKHAEKSVYDVYGESYYEEHYRKWREAKKYDAIDNITVSVESEDATVDPQIHIDIAYKYTTKYNPWKREKTPTVGDDETHVHIDFTIDPGALKVLP